MNSPRTVFFALGLSLVAFACSGCGPSGPQRVEVTGTVTFAGQPIAEGTITFRPEDAGLQSMGGGTIKDGKFEIPAANGLLPGRYLVLVNAPDPKKKAPAHPDDPPGVPARPSEILNKKYNTETELRADVTQDGPNQFAFDLK